MSSRLSKPEGYYVNLEFGHRYRLNAEEYLANVLAEALFNGNDLDNIDEASAMKLAARHALVAITHSGIELVFGDEGEFKYVVT